jgi:hypothetical protein
MVIPTYQLKNKPLSILDWGFLFIFVKTIRDMERFSMMQVIKDKFGEPEKNVKTAKSTKRAKNKVDGKYEVKIVDGVKYMMLK